MLTLQLHLEQNQPHGFSPECCLVESEISKALPLAEAPATIVVPQLDWQSTGGEPLRAIHWVDGAPFLEKAL